MKTISVLIITHNRPNELLRCIQSVLTHLPKSNIIVIDNGTQHLENPILSNKKITYEKVDSSYNLNKSRNYGLQLCDSDYIFSLDDDAYIEYDNFYQKVQLIISKYKHIGILSLNLIENNKKIFDGSLRKVSFFLEGASLINKEIINKGVIFKENQEMYGENLYFLFQTLKKGYEVVLEPTVCVKHEPNYDLRSKEYNKKRIYNHILQSTSTFFIYFPFIDAFILALGVIAIHSIHAFKSSIYAITTIKAFVALCLNIPNIINARSLLDKKLISRYLYSGVYSQLPEEVTPDSYTTFQYILDKLVRFKSSLKLWNE